MAASGLDAAFVAARGEDDSLDDALLYDELPGPDAEAAAGGPLLPQGHPSRPGQPGGSATGGMLPHLQAFVRANRALLLKISAGVVTFIVVMSIIMASVHKPRPAPPSPPPPPPSPSPPPPPPPPSPPPSPSPPPPPPALLPPPSAPAWLSVCAPYAAARTNDASNNRSVACTLALQPGDQVEVSNCATAVGDTFSRLFSPNGLEAVYNDDGCGLTSYGSRFIYSVPCAASDNAGPWRLAQGCFGVDACSGTTVMRVLSSAGCSGPQPPPRLMLPPPPRAAMPPPPLPNACAPFSVANTMNAARNASALCPLTLAGGVTYRISVDCDTFVGDPFLRLFDPSLLEKAYNDDAFFCGNTGTGSSVTYTVPCRYGPSSRWTLAQGCYAITACSGRVTAAFEPDVLPVICPP